MISDYPPSALRAATQHHLRDYNPTPQLKTTHRLATESRSGDISSLDHFGFEVEGHKPLAHLLDGEWQKKMGCRQLDLAMGKFLNTRRPTINTLKSKMRISESADAVISENSHEVMRAPTLQAADALYISIENLIRDAPADWSRLPECNVLVQQIDQLRTAYAAIDPATHSDGEQVPGHEHGGGGAIVIDVDEAIHGLYAAVSYAVQAMKGGAKEIGTQFREDAGVLRDSPLEWVKDQGAPHGMSDFAMGVGVGGVLLPFSVLAMKAGVEEVRGARHEHKRLKKMQASAAQSVSRFNRTSSAAAPASHGAPDPLGPQRIAAQQRLDDVKFSIKQNNSGGMIGAFSFGSGAAIAAKVGLEIGSKAAYIATSGAAGPLAATAASGIAGTFALGPLAAASAVGLGGYMVHKSAKKAKAFTEEKNLAVDFINQAPGTELHVANYRDFLSQKLDQHEKFYNDYRDWNKGFLAGSGIYAAGTLAKVGVVAAASAGAVALAEPATLATVIALGALGGAVMGASSHQFLSGHGRHHRYEQYFKDDDLELDRHFLAAADLLHRQDMPGSLPGLHLRAAFHQHIYQREEARQDLLEIIAQQTNKRFGGRYTYTADSPETRKKRGEKPDKKQRIKTQLNQRKEDASARLAAGRTFGRMLLSGAAVDEARKTWNDNRTVLGKTHVAEWIKGNDIDEHMQRQLEHQLSTLEQRMNSKLSSFARMKVQSVGFARVDLELESGKKLADVLIEMDDGLEKDNLFYRQLTEALDSLQTPAQDDAEKSVRIGRFVSLQQGKLFSASEHSADLEQSHRDLARHLLEDAPERYRDLRGQLIETELEASRMRRRFDAEISGERTSGLNADTAPVKRLWKNRFTGVFSPRP